MAKKEGVSLTCPIRGRFISYQEEDVHAIECIKYLINEKGIEKDNILIQPILKRFGAGGKNNLKPDVLVLKRPLAKGEALDPINVIIAAEVKVSPTLAEKGKALEYQLFPAMDFCKNIEYGIYWDKVSRECYNSNKDKISISSMYGDENIELNDLLPIQHGDEIWDNMEVLMRSLNGSGKINQEISADLIKVIITKYYDETCSDKITMYKKSNEEPKDFKIRINKLYKKACEYYDFKESLMEYLKGEIKLTDDGFVKCMELIQDYALSETKATIIQNFYMKFAPKFLKKDLDQYYTPKEIVEFMTGSAKLNKTTKALDPCSGTGDMMVSIFNRIKNFTNQAHQNVHCWDIDKDIVALAQLNMILVGDGRSNITCRDSLEEYNFENGKYNLIITNPPFGNKNIFKGKNKDKYDNSEKKVGKLFIERDLNLLKAGGLLITVIPSGYMNNPDDEEFRQIIAKKARILALVKLPGGMFSNADTSVETSILYLQKTASENNNANIDYNIFVSWVENVGYKVGSKKYKPKYIREDATGAYKTNNDNDKIQHNDLMEVLEKIKSFALDEDISCLVHADSDTRMDYDIAKFSSIKNNKLILNPMQYTSESDGYRKTVHRIKTEKNRDFFTLQQIEADVTQSERDKIEIEKIYNYLRTGNIKQDQILELEKLRGWNLPDRAKIDDVKPHDIIMAAMKNSERNFGYIYDSYPELIISNGFFRIRIKEEINRLSFYKFLLSEDYKIQIKALPSGSIMPTVKKNDLENLLHIPLLNENEAKKIKEMLKNKNSYIELYGI